MSAAEDGREHELRTREAFLLVHLLEYRGPEQKAALGELYTIRLELGEIPCPACEERLAPARRDQGAPPGVYPWVACGLQFSRDTSGQLTEHDG